MSRGFAMVDEGDDDGCLVVERQCVNVWGRVLQFYKKKIAVMIIFPGGRQGND